MPQNTTNTEIQFFEEVKKCKWCNYNVIHINDKSLPHNFETGNWYSPSDFILHNVVCSPNTWAEKVIRVKLGEKNGKIRSTNK